MISTILLDAGELQRLTDERRVHLSSQWGPRRRRAGRGEAVTTGVPAAPAAARTEARTGPATRPQPRHAAAEPLPRLPAPETLLLADRGEPAGPVRSSR